jgi:hypothetical protein
VPPRKKIRAPAEPNPPAEPPADTAMGSESAIRGRILARAKTITQEINPRLSVVIANLEGGHYPEALAVLYDIESQIKKIRTILSFLDEG